MSDEDLLEELAGILTGIAHVRTSQDANDGTRQLMEVVTEDPGAVLLLVARIGALRVGGFDDSIRQLCITSLIRIMFEPLAYFTSPNTPQVSTPFKLLKESAIDKIEKVLVDGLKMETDMTMRDLLGKHVALWAKKCNKRKRLCLQILPTIVELTRSNRPWHRRTAFQVMAEAPVLLRNSLDEGSITVDDIVDLIRVGFLDTSIDVQVQAVWTLAKVVMIDGKPILGGEEPRLSLLREAFQLVSQYDRRYVDDALEALADIAVKRPSALVPLIDDVFQFLLILMSPPTYGHVPYTYSSNPLIDSTFEDWAPVGHLAAEMFINLAEAFPEKLNKPKRRQMLKDFVGVQLGAHISELFDEGDSREWAMSQEPEDGESAYPDDTLSIFKLSETITSDAMYQETLTHAGALLRLEDWRARYCSLFALSNVVAGGRKVESVVKDLPSLFGFIDPARNDPHPRVRSAWLYVIGQMCIHAPGVLQKAHFLLALSGSLTMLQDDCTRVRAEAASTARSILDGAEGPGFTWFLVSNVTKVLDALVGAYGMGPDHVRVSVMRAMKSLAVFAGSRCQPLYATWMTFLLSQLDQPGVVLATRLVIIDTAVALGRRVGKHRFMSHALQLATHMLRCQNETSDTEDLLPGDLLSSWTRMAIILGTDFAPLLPEVMPDILAIAERDPDTDEGPTLATRADPSPPESEAMTEKAQALLAIGVYVQATGYDFSEWFNQTGHIVSKAVTNRFPANVREAALSLIPILMKAALDLRRITQIPPLIDAVYDFYLYAFLPGATWGTDYPVLTICYRSMQNAFEAVTELPESDFFAKFIDQFLHRTAAVMKMTHGRIAARIRNTVAFGASYDEDDMEAMRAEVEEESEALDELRHVLRQMRVCTGDGAIHGRLDSLAKDIDRIGDDKMWQ